MIRDEYEKEQCFITSYSEMEEDIDIRRAVTPLDARTVQRMKIFFTSDIQCSDKPMTFQ